jgi:hypothetical protein
VIRTDELLPLAEATRRVRADHDILAARIDGRTDAELHAAHQVAGGPLGDFCESLHDLVAHVLMWEEINLAVLTEAAAGRSHWSLDPRWEEPEVGRALNRGGVAAGRFLPTGLVRHRLGAVHDALLAELARLDGGGWAGIGPIAQHVWTIPGQPPYWHAALHLRQVPHQHPEA